MAEFMGWSALVSLLPSHRTHSGGRLFLTGGNLRSARGEVGFQKVNLRTIGRVLRVRLVHSQCNPTTSVCWFAFPA
jgi:hypothetical protein